MLFTNKRLEKITISGFIKETKADTHFYDVKKRLYNMVTLFLHIAKFRNMSTDKLSDKNDNF